MKYHILTDGKRIASFVQQADRDVSLDALIEYWAEDCNFTVEDD